MGLYQAELTVQGPGIFDQLFPMPSLPAKTPRGDRGRPLFQQEVAVLAIPADTRLPGHDFVFQLDPPGLQTLDHAVLYNTPCEDPGEYGGQHLFTKDFSIAISTGKPTEADFREVLQASLEPTTDPQRFDLPPVEALYVRLRLKSGHNSNSDRIQLGEFELFNKEGTNVVASHVVDRSRDGAQLLRAVSALGQDRTWTAGNIHDGAKSAAHGSWSSAGAPPIVVKDPNSIVDLTDRLGPDGRLKWEIPAGTWLITRFVCLNTGETLKVPSPNSNGLATDHLSAEATSVFLNYLIAQLESEVGDLSQTALKQLYLASYEVRGPIWTPNMLEQFRGYRGYDLKPFLPALSGHMIANTEITQRFMYDYRKTLGDLLVDAYYRTAVETAHSAGLGIESEAGGPGPPIHQVPVDALKAQGTIDEVRGEFWPKRPQAHQLWVVKETACAAHIYGKRRVHMEAFTSMHHWQDGPIDLKPSADRALCEGTNHFVWHTASHLPPEAGKPGWVYGAGTHLNTNLIWWPKAKAFLDYLARCSFMLQQGLFVGDVCYYYGDQGYNFVPPKHVDPSLGYGFDYDVTNRDVILNRMRVVDGRITLPDGMNYALLVLPNREDIDLDVLKKLVELVEAGATVVGPKPTRSNGLTGYPTRDEEVRNLAELLWGPCDGKTVREHQFGRGRVIWGRSLREILQGDGVGPDFSFRSAQRDTDIDFIHRKTDDADIYFVRNKRDRWEDILGTFRVERRGVELWHPDTGQVVRQFEYRETGQGTEIPLVLPPHGSVFVVFRDAAPAVGALGVHARRKSEGFRATRVVDWDGNRVGLRVFEPGQYAVTLDDGRSCLLEATSIPKAVTVQGPWNVQFPADHQTTCEVSMEQLVSWTEIPRDDVCYFSGTATYQRTIELPPDWLDENRHVYLDLGRLWAVGEVFLNGQSLGVVWKPPYVVDLTAAAKAGSNDLVVSVSNTWSNRLVGDAKLGEGNTRTNISHSKGSAWKNTPLLESGLFGPVRLIPAKTVHAELP
jgi:hypothetical protein